MSSGTFVKTDGSVILREFAPICDVHSTRRLALEEMNEGQCLEFLQQTAQHIWQIRNHILNVLLPQHQRIARKIAAEKTKRNTPYERSLTRKEFLKYRQDIRDTIASLHIERERVRKLIESHEDMIKARTLLKNSINARINFLRQYRRTNAKSLSSTVAQYNARKCYLTACRKRGTHVEYCRHYETP